MRIIKNTSKYEAKTLRLVLCRVHAHMKKLERRSAPNWKNLNVKISGRPTGGWQGWAYFNGHGYEWDVRFTLGNDMTYRGFAIAVYHELMHTYGYRHKAYNDMPYSEAEKLFPDEGPLPRTADAVKVAKPKTPAWRKKYASAVARKKVWEAKAKRAENALKKLNKTIKYYESRYET